MHSSSPNFPSRITIALSLFILCSLLSTLRELKDAPTPRGLHPDPIAKRSDQRFAILKPALPQQGVVGYIGESGDLADYYLTQYALAPLVVDHSPNHALVVANFPTSPPSIPSPDHLQLLKDFGNGVLLFANKDAQ